MSSSDHFYSPPISLVSDYVLRLDDVSKSRYLTKLLFEDDNKSTYQLVDPYVLLDHEWKNDLSSWPNIEYPDIFHFLTNSPGGYNSEQLKNYKSLSAYEYVQSGKVQTIFIYKPKSPKGISFLKALVQPSQRLNDELHKPWVLVRDCGKVELAHCTCVAGLGESCSHIAAQLFKVELAVRLGYTKSAPTDNICAWNSTFTKKLETLPLEKISFEKPHLHSPKKRKRQSNVIPLQVSSPLTMEEISSLKEVKPGAAFFTSFDDSSTDSASEDGNELPPTMLDIILTDQVAKKLEPADLLPFFSEELCNNLEKSTVGQHKNAKWVSHRKGRLTASHFGQVIQRKSWSDKFIHSMVSQKPFTAPSIRWGINHEEDAIKFYVYKSEQDHGNFKYQTTGLFVNPAYPFLGASPDGLVSCSCCGTGVVEVKCPYTHRTKAPLDISTVDKKFCLDIHGYLKEDHEYFYQIQGQMAISQTKFCDFVVWTPVGMTVVRVRFDEDIWKKMFETLKKFYFSPILNKLQEKKSTA